MRVYPIPRAKTLLAIGALVAPLLWAGGTFAFQAVPSDDVHFEGTSRIDGERLRISNSGPSRTFIKFILSPGDMHVSVAAPPPLLPTDVGPDEILVATLRVFVDEANPGGSFDVREVTSAWSETTGNAPTIGDTIATVTVSGNRASRYVLVDVTELVRKWRENPASNFGIALVPVGTLNVFLASKENQSRSQAPRLDIVLDRPADEDDNGNGVTGFSEWERVAGDSGNFSASPGRRTATAACPEGKNVLGGGVEVRHSNPTTNNQNLVAEKVHVSASYPSNDTTWTAVMWSQDQTANYLFQVWVICAKVE